VNDVSVHEIPMIGDRVFALIRFAFQAAQEAIALHIVGDPETGKFEPCWRKVDIGHNILAYRSRFDAWAHDKKLMQRKHDVNHKHKVIRRLTGIWNDSS